MSTAVISRPVAASAPGDGCDNGIEALPPYT